MDILKTIIARRAIKHYDPNFVIPKQDIHKLLEYAILSPTSFNMQHWRFVVVEDKKIREEIRKAAFDQPHVSEASLLFVMCANLKAWHENPERYWKDAPEEVQKMILPMIENFYKGKPQLERDEAIRSIGIAAQTIMLTAKSIGYDSCPMIGFDPQKVAKIINLPKDHIIGMLIAVGKAIKPAWPKPGQLPLNEVWIKNSF